MALEKEEFILQMKRLAQCELEIEEWDNWWLEKSYDIQKLINKGEFLRIKPIKHDSKWLPILRSQQGAIVFLEDNSMTFKKSQIYQKNYDKDFAQFCKEEENARKEIVKNLKSNNPLLFEVYPKFSLSLKFIYSKGDKLGVRASEEDIKRIESNIQIKLQKDIVDFFKVISVINLEGIKIDVKELDIMEFLNEKYLVLGEYWKEADGDKLLISLSNLNSPIKILYYAHEQNKIKLLCKSISDLMEKEFTKYNRSFNN
jgi:hypothetical protein